MTEIRILSLDDEPEFVDLLRLTLSSSGYEFVGTTSDQKALSILRTGSVDLFIQDFMRPDPGGLEFLRRVKSEPVLKSIPVLGISAGPRDTRAAQLEQVGLDMDRDLDGYTQKPFISIDLLDMVEAILTKRVST
ncbi:MAG: response regulator [Chloroflexi bacterium]|nr:response regulator [Chloroflexota bacterium]